MRLLIKLFLLIFILAVAVGIIYVSLSDTVISKKTIIKQIPDDKLEID